MGDFNLHVDDLENSDSMKFLDLLESYGLQQHVTVSTHKHGHTLDLIITRQLIKDSPCVDRYISDHAAVLCSLHSDKPSLTAKNVSYGKLKAINLDSLNEDLAASKLCQDSPEELEELVACYNDTLKRILDKHAPLKTRTIVVVDLVYHDSVMRSKRRNASGEKLTRSGDLPDWTQTLLFLKQNGMLLPV